jgi:hypothetical protein
MEHTPTPTPWIEIANFFGVEKAKRIVECVNACVEFPDPKIDIGLLKLHAEQQTKLLASCEAALAERDKEIAKLKELAVEVNILEKDGHIQAVGIKQMNVEEYTLQSEQIQALQDRIKKLEGSKSRFNELLEIVHNCVEHYQEFQNENITTPSLDNAVDNLILCIVENDTEI